MVSVCAIHVVCVALEDQMKSYVNTQNQRSPQRRRPWRLAIPAASLGFVPVSVLSSSDPAGGKER